MPVLNKYFFWGWFALLMAAAAYIRVHGVDYYHYHADELMHIGIAKGKDMQQVLQFSLLETHPPLGHLLRYFWLKISDEIWFVREQSLVFGLALIPLYYAIGKKLKDPLTGMCAAVLITFSRGCIIQSYVVRNYSMFMFFLSAAFYFYLLWRDDRKNTRLLVGYFISALFACLTHFAAILAIFYIALYELMCSTDRIKWGAINLLLGVLSVFTALFWHGTVTPVRNIAEGGIAAYSFSDSFLLVPLYILNIISYLFPGDNFIFLLILAMPIAISGKSSFLNALLWLPAGAFILAMLLFFTGIYPFAGDRHSYWMLPFFVVPASVIISEACLLLTRSISLSRQYYLGVIVITAAGLLFYNPGERFKDSLEYQMTEPEWSEISDYLRHIDSNALLVSGRTDAIMLSPAHTNIYNYIGKSAPGTSHTGVIVPYYDTHLFFNNQYDMRLYESSVLARMVHSADRTNNLNDYDKLVFVNTYLSSPAIVKLITCQLLDKKIMVFPAIKQGDVLDSANIGKYKAIFVIVKKQDFLEEVLADGGKAHSCIAEK